MRSSGPPFSIWPGCFSNEEQPAEPIPQNELEGVTQTGLKKSYLCYYICVSKKKRPVKTFSVEISQLKGNREGAILKDEVWYENEKVIAYNLAYINLRRCHVDHGRVLGYDNSHGYHHRHFMGKVGPIEYTTYDEHVKRFIAEVHKLWRIEDEED
jgi:hypothetical protein